MILLRDEIEKDKYSSAEEYINRFGIIPAKVTKYTVTYYMQCSYSYTKTKKVCYLKKVKNVRTGRYQCFELKKRPHGVPVR